MKIAFQGEIGAFSQIATQKLFPNGEDIPCNSFEQVFLAVENGDANYGVIPIENTLFGSVHINYDLLRSHNLKIVGELNLRVKHNLLAKEGTDLDKITKVYSHAQAIGQCQEFLKNNLPNAEIIAANDTAGSARRVSESSSNTDAAVASIIAAKEYNLNILSKNIESHHENYTRFLALSKNLDVKGLSYSNDKKKTSLVYAMKENVPGALFKSLAVFALREIDLYKIESRPLIGSPGKYLFYLDINGRESDDAIKKAYGHLDEIADFVKSLGSYPQANFDN